MALSCRSSLICGKAVLDADNIIGVAKAFNKTMASTQEFEGVVGWEGFTIYICFRFSRMKYNKFFISLYILFLSDLVISSFIFSSCRISQ